MTSVTQEISIAQFFRHSDELDQIQRLRYQVYVRELGLQLPGVDHLRQLLADPLDTPAIHITARFGSELIGAVRLNLNVAPSQLEIPLQVPTLPRPFVYCSRLNVLDEFRGQGIVQDLTRACFEEFASRDAAVAICHCYPHLNKLYRRMGFQSYGTPFVTPSLEHLGVQSPMRCVLKKQECDVTSLTLVRRTHSVDTLIHLKMDHRDPRRLDVSQP